MLSKLSTDTPDLRREFAHVGVACPMMDWTENRK